MKNTLKEKMLRGEKTLGTFHELGSASVVECIGYAGFDYVVIDSEHGPFDVETALTFIRSAKLVDLVPLVRVKDSNRNSILKMLDVGAMGLIIPNINSVEEVKDLVKYGKYYPVGERGVAPTAGSQFWQSEASQNGLENFFKIKNEESLLLPQCETRACLDNIEEIAFIEGVDGIFVGPYDLSTALGRPGQFDNLEFSSAIGRIVKACKDANKFAFVFTGEETQVKEYYDKGFDSVAYNLDAIMLIQAMKNAVNNIKMED